jgi:ubiquinone/menaquinone biosynthesis C-methylase UbiE
MSNVEVAAASKSEYVEFWNNVLVPKFVRWRHILVGGLTLHSAKVFPSLAVREGDALVDAGCGFGDRAIQLARLVGPKGSVLAIDCCDGFLQYGRQDAKAAGIDNVTFLEADVETHPFRPVHDFCFSRFGTQFFQNPVAGLRNMRASLKPGGTMTMIDTGVVTKQLEIAGYKDIRFEQIDAQVFVGKDLDDAVAFQLAIGPAGEVYREAGTYAEQRHDEIARALRAELARYQQPNGVMMDSSSWKVTARNPG